MVRREAVINRQMAPAGDRFDSDCVVGTHFESSQAHHTVFFGVRPDNQISAS